MARRVRVMFTVEVPDGDDLDCLGDALAALDGVCMSDLTALEVESPFTGAAGEIFGDNNIEWTAEVVGSP